MSWCIEGSYSYWHTVARRNFSKDQCEWPGCKETNKSQLKKTGKKLHLHCVDRDYTNQEASNWKNLCNKHHAWQHRLSTHAYS